MGYVTQADRESAARLVSKMGDTTRALNITCGNLDDAPEVQAFARHRTIAIRSLADDPAMVERAARAMCVADWAHDRLDEADHLNHYKERAHAALRAIGEPGLVELERVTKYAHHETGQ